MAAMTLNSWLGVDLFDKPAEFYIERFNSGAPNYREAAKRARRVYVLLVDEVSMLRAENLEKFSHIMQWLREDSRPFGGVMMVLLGEAVQLGPVMASGEIGQRRDREAAFAELFYYQFVHSPIVNPHAIFLRGIESFAPNMVVASEQYRIQDPKLLKVAMETREGGHGLSDDSLAALRSRLHDVESEVVIHRDASAALPHHVDENARNDTMYRDVREQLGVGAQEEIYCVRAYTKSWMADGTIGVVHIEEMQAGAVKAKLRASMEMLRHRPPKLSVGGIYALTKTMQLRDTSGLVVKARVGDVVTCVGFDDGVGVELGSADANERRNGVYPIVKDVRGQTYTMRPKVTEVGIATAAHAKLYVSHLPLRYGWAGTVHVYQGVTVRAPNQLVVDLSGCFTHGQGYVALTRVEQLDQLVLLGLDTTKLFVCLR